MNPNEVLWLLRASRTVTFEGPLTFEAEILEVQSLGNSETTSLHLGFEIRLRTIGAPTEKPQPLDATPVKK
jgi:hypothetical protein